MYEVMLHGSGTELGNSGESCGEYPKTEELSGEAKGVWCAV